MSAEPASGIRAEPGDLAAGTEARHASYQSNVHTCPPTTAAGHPAASAAPCAPSGGSSRWAVGAQPGRDITYSAFAPLEHPEASIDAAGLALGTHGTARAAAVNASESSAAPGSDPAGGRSPADDTDALLGAVRKYKYNSTSSVMTARSTLATPEPRELLLCVSTVLHCQMLADDASIAGDGEAVVQVAVGDTVPGNIFNESVILRFDPDREPRQLRARAHRRDDAHAAASISEEPAMPSNEPAMNAGAAPPPLADARAPVAGAFLPSVRCLPSELQDRYGISSSTAPLLVAAGGAAPAPATSSTTVRTAASTDPRAQASLAPAEVGAAAPGAPPNVGTQEFLYQLYVAQALAMASRGASGRGAFAEISSSDDEDGDTGGHAMPASTGPARHAAAVPGHVVRGPPSPAPPRMTLVRVPCLDEVYEFIAALFTTAKFSTQCAVIAVIYLNRMVAKRGIALHAGNWRPLLLTALLLAQKVWDDKSLSVTDFAVICPLFTPAQIQRLEREFLKLVSYQLSVSQSLFAKYYFELRSLSEELAPGRPTLKDPLSAMEAKRLEMRSSMGARLPSIAEMLRDARVTVPAAVSMQRARMELGGGSAFASYAEGMPYPARGAERWDASPFAAASGHFLGSTPLASGAVATGDTGVTTGELGFIAGVPGSARSHGRPGTKAARPASRDLESATYAASPSMSRFVLS